MAKNNLIYDLNRKALTGFVSEKRTLETGKEIKYKEVTNDETRKKYKQANKKFATFARSRGVRMLKNVTIELVQDWAAELATEGKSVSTIHTYLAPICRALEIDMKEIKKDKRTIDQISRGRVASKNPQGQKELESEKFQRLVTLAPLVGLRRSEYKRLTPDSLFEKDGLHYVKVKGKGGKVQEQIVLPTGLDVVKNMLADPQGWNPELNEHQVFSDAEMNNKINLHAMRADYAKEFYRQVLAGVNRSTNNADRWRELLLKRFEEGNVSLKESKPSLYNRRLADFKKSMDTSTVYRPRGKSLKIAKEKGLPTEYNRLALTVTSVFALSHWRNDVTVINYLLATHDN